MTLFQQKLSLHAESLYLTAAFRPPEAPEELKSLARRHITYIVMSLVDALSDTLYWMGFSPSGRIDWKQRMVLLFSGNAYLGVCYSCFSTYMLVKVFLNGGFDQETFVAASMYNIGCMSAWLKVFWGINRQQVRETFAKLRDVAVLMQKDFANVNMGCKFVPFIKLLDKLMWYGICSEVAAIACLPIHGSLLPTPLQGPWPVLCVQLYQSMMILQVGICAYFFYWSQLAFILYFRSCLDLLGDFIQAADDTTVTNIARIHSKLLVVSEIRRLLFSPWNLFMISFCLLISLFNTVILVMGVISPTLNCAIVVGLGLPFFLCTAGNVLEVACEKFAYDVYRTKWYFKTPYCKKILLNILMRSRKPEKCHAKVFGTVSNPLFIRLCRNYYRFVQALLNLQ